MGTKFKFEQGPMVSAATITTEDGASCFVFCSIPGGTPQFQVDRASRYATSVVNAPAMDSHKAFKAFVTERFGDDA